MKLSLRIVTIFLFLSTTALTAATAAKQDVKTKKSTTVAIVVDENSYKTIRPSLEKYADAIEKYDGKRTETVVCGSTCNPDSIRTILKSLYRNDYLEGAILIGEVPIPMIRDAQHLTTAFKMDQRNDWKESSVPSDRFYDDFDLLFDDLGRDSTAKLLHYYTLRADSPQQIACDIYSSRIKVPFAGQCDAAEACGKLAGFLDRAADAKQAPENLEEVMFFAGQGYNSDSYEARCDERGTLMQQFPEAARNGHVRFINFDEDRYIKERLLGTLAMPHLDLAILHHHGSPEEQYLSRAPYANTADTYIEGARKIFRGRIRNAKDTAAKKASIIKEYGIPEMWTNDAFDKETALKDSLADAALDIYPKDLEGYVSNVKMLIIDACFNGSFNNDYYIAGEYLFNGGETMVVKANTVNTLQDTWTNELIGLNGLGVCAGKWAMGQMTLESHLLGDATHRFKCADSRYEKLDAAMSDPKTDWLKYADSDNPDVHCLAIKRLSREGKLDSGDLLEIQRNSPSELARLEALNLQSRICDKNLEEALRLALDDNYELTVRLASKFAEKAGFTSLLPLLAQMDIDPLTSERVAFHINTALNLYNPEDVAAAMDSVRNATQNIWPSENAYAESEKYLENSWKSRNEEYASVNVKSTPDKELKWTIGSERNNCNPYAVEPLLTFIADSANSSVRRVQAVETLGWYRFSCKKNEIVGRIAEMMKGEKDETVRNEMEKTLARLK